MPTVPPQSSPFAAILSAVLARLVSSLGINAAFVVPVASDDYVLTELEDFFLRVHVQKPRPVNPGDGGTLINQGAGRVALDVSRYLRVYAYSRQGLDTTAGDPIALMGSDPSANHAGTPAVVGHLLFEERILNSLHHFAPLDADGVCLSVGPVRWTDQNDAPERKPEDDEGVLRSYLDFEVVYVTAIDTSEPAP